MYVNKREINSWSILLATSRCFSRAPGIPSSSMWEIATTTSGTQKPSPFSFFLEQLSRGPGSRLTVAVSPPQRCTWWRCGRRPCRRRRSARRGACCLCWAAPGPVPPGLPPGPGALPGPRAGPARLQRGHFPVPRRPGHRRPQAGRGRQIGFCCATHIWTPYECSYNWISGSNARPEYIKNKETKHKHLNISSWRHMNVWFN